MDEEVDTSHIPIVGWRRSWLQQRHGQAANCRAQAHSTIRSTHRFALQTRPNTLATLRRTYSVSVAPAWPWISCIGRPSVHTIPFLSHCVYAQLGTLRRNTHSEG